MEEVWKKSNCFNLFKSEWDIHSVDDILVRLGDFHGHVGGYDGVYGGYGVFGKKNFTLVLSGDRIICDKYMV